MSLISAAQLSKAPIPDNPENTFMLILSAGLGHRYMSETRAAVCLILGPVFVLWFKASSGWVAGGIGAADVEARPTKALSRTIGLEWP
jgi:hypothetical protein